MTDDYGKSIAKDTVRIERLLPGPIERVWDYVTQSDKRAKWLAAGTMELRVGGAVNLQFMHADLTPHQETIPDRYKDMDSGHQFAGTVTQCDPPRLLSFTWNNETSEVKFELTPQDSRVLLVITHTRLRDRDEMACVAAGWHTHLGILEDNLQDKTPRPFWSVVERLELEYLQRL
jgi:uncharacterized protein YndB with AHSA1/START domain